VRAGKLTTFAILSGAVGLLFSGPTLLGSGPMGWTAETFYICSAAAGLGQIVMRSRAQRRLLADLQEHEAALHPEAADHPPATVEAATRAIVDSAERIVSRATAKSTELELRVRELELQLRVTQMALQVADAALEHTSGAAIEFNDENELVLANAMAAHTFENDALGFDRRDRELNEMKTAFVSKVSHELRTPLASIKAYVEMLIDGEATDPATQMQFYEIIQNEANRLGKLIDGTLKSPA
jgi:signal transduction histidine kinase